MYKRQAVIGGSTDPGVWTTSVKDTGPTSDTVVVDETSNNASGGGGTQVPIKQTYTGYWHPTTSTQYQGTLQSTGVWNNRTMTNFASQGHTSTYPARHTLLDIGSAASISGSSETGISIYNAVKNAAFNSIRLRITNYDQYLSKVPLLLGWQSGTGIPTPIITTAPVGRGQSITIDLTNNSSFKSFLKASGSKYLTLGPGPQSTNTYWSYYYGCNGTAGRSGQRMTLEIKYTR